jgi:SAM-dependent methyltransferase
VSFSYSNVDAGADPHEAADWQELLNAWPAIQAYKQHTYRLLADAGPGRGPILDVGCGPGTDAAALGPARVIGIDPSTVMLARAAARGIRVCRGDALALPFADGAFAGCRIDRVLQHLDDPMRALDELVRVVRPAGRIVVADPQQESLIIHIPGVPVELVDRVKQLRRDVGYRNGRLVGDLPGRFGALGLVDVDVTAFPLVITDPDRAFGLPTWPRHWRDRGVARWTDDELDRWDHGIRSARQQGGFVYALLYLVVTARRP